MQELHTKMAFTGGNETTPVVEVVRFHNPGFIGPSMARGGSRPVIIEQDGERVRRSRQKLCKRSWTGITNDHPHRQGCRSFLYQGLIAAFIVLSSGF